jgi:hypothetical protein
MGNSKNFVIGFYIHSVLRLLPNGGGKERLQEGCFPNFQGGKLFAVSRELQIGVKNLRSRAEVISHVRDKFSRGWYFTAYKFRFHLILAFCFCVPTYNEMIREPSLELSTSSLLNNLFIMHVQRPGPCKLLDCFCLVLFKICSLLKIAN